MRSIRLLVVCALGVTWMTFGVFASDAHAAQGQGRPGGPGRQGAGRQGVAPDGAASPVELQELMDAMVLVQAERDLELTNEQLPQFLRRFKGLQATRRRSENQRNRALMELRRLMQPGNAGDGGRPAPPDEAQIRERLKAIDDVEAASTVEIKQARTVLEQILNPRQQARFRLLEEQVERRKLELFARSRQAPPPK